LLGYENALIAQKNERALAVLAKETKDENSKMRILSVSPLVFRIRACLTKLNPKIGKKH